MIVTVTRGYRSFDVVVSNENEATFIQTAEQVLVVLPVWEYHQARETDVPTWKKSTDRWTEAGWGRDYRDTEEANSLLWVVAKILERFIEQTDWGKQFVPRLPPELVHGLAETEIPNYRPRRTWLERVKFRLSPHAFRLSQEEWDQSRRRRWAVWEEITKYALSNPRELGIAFLTRDEHYGAYRLVRRGDYEHPSEAQCSE